MEGPTFESYNDDGLREGRGVQHLSRHRFGILMTSLQLKDRLLTCKQVAERLNVKEQTLANWRFRGDKRLNWRWHGGRTILYLESDVKRFIEANKTAPG